MNDSLHDRISERLNRLHADGLFRKRRTVKSLPDGYCVIDGQKLVNFGGNDYLSLAHVISRVPAVPEAFSRQIGSTASSVVAGRSEEMEQLEDCLASFERTASALVFPSGYAANLGVLQAIVESNDAVFCDKANHASIIDAARNCEGAFHVYRSTCLEKLEESIARRRSDFQQVFLVTDGVFSMDGTVADLNALCRIASRLDCHVIVDEAHATGVLGTHGRGSTEATGTEDDVLLRIGTMSKAMGGLGGFVVGDMTIIEWLRNRSRTQFFSTALPPGICTAMRESVQWIVANPESRVRLKELTEFAHDRIRQLGLTTIPKGRAPIIPIIVGDDSVAVETSAQLSDEGFFAPAIRPPTVPIGTARLRLSVTVRHTEKQIAQVLERIHALTAIPQKPGSTHI